MHPPRVQHLSRSQWRRSEQAHRSRVEPWIRPRLERRSRGEKHPVDDFMFEYYSFRPAQLARWQPGVSATLEPPADDLVATVGFRLNEGRVEVDPAGVGRQAALLPQIDALLQATQERPVRIGCAALHEWAMVYGLATSEVRHSAWPLRLAPQRIAEVVDHVGLRCTHFDAYRFFTAEAAPKNATPLRRATQLDFEQPGCLHATMDLYKCAYRLSPLVGADLIADAFELARSARELDMRSAPYDLRVLGVEPLPVETPAGRAQFAALQRELALLGNGLRQRLRDQLAEAKVWLAATGAAERVAAP